MSAKAQPVIEAALHGALPQMERPAYAAAAVGVFVVGAAAERLYSHVENRQKAVPLADPEVAQAARVNGRRTRVFNTAAYYAASAMLAFGVAKESLPYGAHSAANGTISVVLDGTNLGDIEDMTDDGKPTTRLQASIDGALDSAERNKVPFAFVVDGYWSQLADSTPAEGKDLDNTRGLINRTLTSSDSQGNSFRNSNPAMSPGVKGALKLANTGPNKIVVIGASLSNADAKTLTQISKELPAKYEEDSLNAVVLGRGAGKINVGGQTASSDTDVKSFTDVLGRNHVQTAQSVEEVAKAIDKVVKKVEVTDVRKRKDIFNKLFNASALLLGGIVASRKLSDLASVLKRRK
jgi:hypothetical protein